MEDKFLTIKEAATMLGVSTLTLRNWDKSGKFTASRHPINNYRVYKFDEVKMLIDDIKSKRWTIEKTKKQGPPAPKKLSVRHEDY